MESAHILNSCGGGGVSLKSVCVCLGVGHHFDLGP
jgi:hypothetical protein